VGVHQVFEDNETAYMVLDFVEGRDLLDTLEDENHGLTPAQIKGILRDVLGAIQFIHEQDILHRDISPDNILLDADMRPVLIDFGAAREEATKKSRVLSAMRVVKDGYSPQEFYIQGSEQTPSSDLYALGASFYHLIAGEIPPNSQARLAAIASGEPDPYEPLNGRIKGYEARFLDAIDTALGILPKDRMQSAEDWIKIIEGGRRKSRVLTQQMPMSSAAAATVAANKKTPPLVPLLGSVAVLALIAVGGLYASGSFSGGDETVAALEVPDQSPAIDTPQVEGDATAVAEVAAAPTSPVAPEVSLRPTAAITPAQPAEVAVAEAPAVETAPTPQAEVTAEVGTVDTQVLGAPVIDVQAEMPVIAALDQSAIGVDAPRDIAASEIGKSFELSAPSKPELTQDSAPAPQPAASIVVSDLGVALPFAALDDSNVIGEAAIVAPVWVRSGTRVVAVNGVEIDKISDIDAVFAAQATPQDIKTKALEFTVQPQADGPVQTHTWTVPVRHLTSLPNGTTFETSFVNGDWRTTVASITDTTTDLKVGDQIVAYVPTSETIEDQASLRNILERELATGTKQFNFAVSREGSMWVVTMTYAEGA